MDLRFRQICQWLFERSGTVLPAPLVDQPTARDIATNVPLDVPVELSDRTDAQRALDR